MNREHATKPRSMCIHEDSTDDVLYCHFKEAPQLWEGGRSGKSVTGSDFSVSFR